MTPTEAYSKALSDHPAKDESLYGLCHMAEGVGLAYRNGWRMARFRAEAAQNPTALTQNSPAMNQNPPPTVRQAKGVSIFATSNEAAKSDTGPTQAISAPPPPEIPPDPRSSRIEANASPETAKAGQDDDQLSLF